jgi:hypothetical protein
MEFTKLLIFLSLSVANFTGSAAMYSEKDYKPRQVNRQQEPVRKTQPKPATKAEEE